MADVVYHFWTHEPNGVDGIAGLFEAKLWPDRDLARILEMEALADTDPDEPLFIIPVLDEGLDLTKLFRARLYTPGGGSGVTAMVRNITKGVDMLTTDLTDDGSLGNPDETGTPPNWQVDLLDEIGVFVTDPGSDAFGTCIALRLGA